MLDHDIEQFIREQIQAGHGPKAIAEDLEMLYGITPSDANALYLEVRGIESPTKGKREASLGIWEDDNADIIYKLLLLNKSFTEIAEHFHVDKFQLNTWKHEIPECSEAWEKALQADFEVVENLLRLCKGYDEDDMKIGFHMGEGIEHEFVKKYQPNLRAIETWLKVKHPSSWKETQHIEANMTHSVENFSEEELEQKLKEFGVEMVESNLSRLEIVSDDN